MFGIHINDVYIPEDLVSVITIQRKQIKIVIKYSAFGKFVNILDRKLLSKTNITNIKIGQLEIKGDYIFSKRTERGTGKNQKLTTYLYLVRVGDDLEIIDPPVLRKKKKPHTYVD